MRGFRTYILLFTALGCFSACEKTGSGRSEDVVPIQLAISVGPSGSSLTKGNPAVITEMSDNVTFRGMTGVTILPFNVINRAVASGDQSSAHPTFLRDISPYIYERALGGGGSYVSGLVNNNWAHLYPAGDISLPGGTASVLAYGCAPLEPVDDEDEIRSRHLNGALEAIGLDAQVELCSAGDIHFNPVPILSGGLPAEAGQLTDLLNAIFVPEVSYTANFWYEDETQHYETITITWNDEIDDNTLRDCFLETTNNGNMMPGSGRSVEYIIGRLYRRLTTYVIRDDNPVEYVHTGDVYPAMKSNNDPLTWGDLYNGLRNALVARIEALDGDGLSLDDQENRVELTSAALRNYPGTLGLPDGAAILRWNGNRFYPVEDQIGDAADGVAPVNAYCYPPRLWYFANSSISTSADDQSSSYTSDRATWADILEEYHYGKIVSSGTQSVAMDQPLQFSCGMLIADVIASSSTLDDGDGDPATTITLTDDTFPVTGVIIGSQQRLNFDFTPAGGRNYFLYDDCIPDLALPTDAPTGFRTLVSQTPDGEDVYLCLELCNNSGQTFVGADGLVLPGSKFYLVGRIDLAGGQTSVFQRDCTTTVHCHISSLAEARNAIPNLEHVNIALGIEISVNWVMATPSHVILS
jgi:hypothetical protein